MSDKSLEVLQTRYNRLDEQLDDEPSYDTSRAAYLKAEMEQVMARMEQRKREALPVIAGPNQALLPFVRRLTRAEQIGLRPRIKEW